MKYKVMYQIRFQENTDYGTLNDAIYLTPEEYVTKKPEDIETLIKMRVDKFIDFRKNPPTYIEPTIAELEKIASNELENFEKALLDVKDKTTVDKLITLKEQLINQSAEIQSKIDEKLLREEK